VPRARVVTVTLTRALLPAGIRAHLPPGSGTPAVPHNANFLRRPSGLDADGIGPRPDRHPPDGKGDPEADRHARARRDTTAAARTAPGAPKRDDRPHLSMPTTAWAEPIPAGGSGLIGLSDRVHALGGSIEVESRRGRGTTIVAELPLRSGARTS
jgi:hypothetical protein